jgi:hypothetical protein
MSSDEKTWLLTKDYNGRSPDAGVFPKSLINSHKPLIINR